jgi:hypothetical protein
MQNIRRTTNKSMYARAGFAISRTIPVIIEDFLQSVPQQSTLTPGYIDWAQKTCRSQLALGGYRLAQLLDDVFGGNSLPPRAELSDRSGIRGAFAQEY